MQMSLEEINPRTSLMGLGMDSLMMLEMRTIIERETGVELSMQLLTSDPSIESIAVYLHEHHASNSSGSVAGSEDISHATDNGGEWIEPERQAGSKMLVRLQPEGNLPPLFFVPAGYGDLIAFQEVATMLGQDRPVFGLQAPGARQIKELPKLTLDQLISTYLAEIKTVQPTGPYYLSGYSAGGIIAVELARELLRTGNQIALLLAIDPPVNVPRWLNSLYSAAYTVCEQSRLSSLVRRSGSHLLRRLFHAVLDEGLRTHTSVLCGHQLESYPGHIDYFRATRSWVSILSLRRCGKFWKHIARGGTEVHWVPGTHYGMLRGGSVAVFAERLRECLKQCAEQVK
jgi:thioesterase domain-containing protein/acyl carrier protein